jgi:hypothetical protein
MIIFSSLVAALELCQETPISLHAAETIRKYYHNLGQKQLSLHFDLIQ